jgi:hypothetical protein
VEGNVSKILGITLLVIGSSALAMGAVPEIGVGSAGSALALLSGTLLVFLGRKKKT